MNFGLYTAYLGMKARQQRLDQIANNIANASTGGYKADRLLYRSVQAAEDQTTQASGAGAASIQTGNQPTTVGTDATGTAAAPTVSDPNAAQLTPVRYGADIGVLTQQGIDFSRGPIRETGNPLDVSLDGDGFLAVQTARGERYTRQGSFTLDSSGQLATQAGDLVLGDNGPITVPPGTITIGQDGTITANGQVAGQLKLVQFTNPSQALAKEGNSLFVATGTETPADATGTTVMQGSLEMSNVSPLTEMVAMMQNSREFESLQKSVTMMMNDLGKTIANQIGNI